VRATDLTPNWRGDLVELASLVVAKERRGEGIGGVLLQRLVRDAMGGARGDGSGSGSDADVAGGDGSDTGVAGGDTAQDVTLCLVTRRSRVPFYARAGFVVIETEEDVPRPLQAEKAAGQLLARFLHWRRMRRRRRRGLPQGQLEADEYVAMILPR